MQRITDLMPSQSQITQGSCETYKTKATLPSDAVVYLFAKLSVKYAHKFTSLFPDELTLHAAQTEWSESLANIGKKQLRHGLDKCIDVYPSWPPTVGEFKKLCKIDVLMIEDKINQPATKAERTIASDKWMKQLKEAIR